MLSEPDRQMEKLGGDHKTRRTAAIASLKVGWCLLYQATGWGQTTVLDYCVIQRIECFRCSRGTLHAERRNRGYTLYRARSGALVARLRPTGSDDRFEVLYL
jgi:hypothetical protein